MSSVPAIIESVEVDRKSLAEHESRIEQHQAGEGLEFRAIRDGRKYRDAGYGDFDTYCRERWGYAENYVNKLIRAAEVRHNLGTNCTGIPLPSTESQVRPLTRLAPDQQVAAWNHAVESAGDRRVTARHVAEAVEALYPPRREEPAEAWEDNPSLLPEPARPSLPGQAELPLGPPPVRERQEIIDVEYEDSGPAAEEFALSPKPEPRTADELLSEQISRHADDMTTFLVTIPRKGGVGKIVASWPPAKRDNFKRLMDRLIAAASDFKAAIERIERDAR